MDTRRRPGLAGAFAAAYLVCPSVEPTPNGPHPVMYWWHITVDVASVVTIVVAVILLTAGRSSAPAWCLAAAAGMVAETILCPGSGHHTVGWYTFVQAVMTAFVLVASIYLLPLRRLRHTKRSPMPLTATEHGVIAVVFPPTHQMPPGQFPPDAQHLGSTGQSSTARAGHAPV